MDEKVLNKAIEIKKNLDKAREIRDGIKKKKELCTGNYSEVEARSFELIIIDESNKKRISISSQSAYEALKSEYENADKVVSAIETELEKL